jgi:CBS domain-containing protein
MAAAVRGTMLASPAFTMSEEKKLMVTEPTSRETIVRLRVADAMHPGVVSCTRDTSLGAVAELMARERIHCVVVQNGNGDSLWGIVSDLDLVAAATVRELHEQTAGGSAGTPVLMIAPDETLERAAQVMTEHAAGHLVVVDPATVRPVGVISTLDIAAALAHLP